MTALLAEALPRACALRAATSRRVDRQHEDIASPSRGASSHRPTRSLGVRTWGRYGRDRVARRWPERRTTSPERRRSAPVVPTARAWRRFLAELDRTRPPPPAHRRLRRRLISPVLATGSF